MVCPACVAAIASQAVVPVATAVGGALAAKSVIVKEKKVSAKPTAASQVKRPSPVLETIDDTLRPVSRKEQN